MEDLALKIGFESLAPNTPYIKGKSSIVEALANHIADLEAHSKKFTSASSGKPTKAHADFDHIIIGSGMGGGMLARYLITQGQKVLLLEKGIVPFKSHCLNASRMHFDTKSQDGPGRDNELVFNTVKRPFKVAATDAKDYGGGAYFALGGRSLFWSLEAPMIVKDAARDNFPPDVANDLYDSSTPPTSIVGSDVGDEGGGQTVSIDGDSTEGWYTKAIRVLANSPPGNTEYPTGQITAADIQTAKAKLNRAVTGYEPTMDAEFVPNGAEFGPGNNLYYFSQHAYSTADWLLDRIFIKDDPSKILINVEVIRFTLDEEGKKIISLDLVDSTGNEKTIPVRKANVILCAGAVPTAAIALRSGKKTADNFKSSDFKDAFKDVKDNCTLVGKGLTDHEIWMAKYWKKILKNEADENPEELSCHVKVNGNPALLTICTHAEKFYGHSFATGEAEVAKELVNVLNIMLEFQAPLNELGTVTLDANAEPFLRLNRTRMDPRPDFLPKLTGLVKAIRKEYGFEDGEGAKDNPTLAKWGSVAHEVGTMRMDRMVCNNLVEGVVDENLKVHGVEQLYVCDLSVFPFSPMANPSRTLTALAMRLGNHLINKHCEHSDSSSAKDGSDSNTGNGDSSDGQADPDDGKSDTSGKHGGILPDDGPFSNNFDCRCLHGGPPPYVCPRIVQGQACLAGSSRHKW